MRLVRDAKNPKLTLVIQSKQTIAWMARNQFEATLEPARRSPNLPCLQQTGLNQTECNFWVTAWIPNGEGQVLMRRSQVRRNFGAEAAGLTANDPKLMLPGQA